MFRILLKKWLTGFTLALLILPYAKANGIKSDTIINLWPQSILTQQHQGLLLTEVNNNNDAISHIGNPRLLVYFPKVSNHKAILVISGGGYIREELGKEGYPASKWLVNQGFTVFNLIYRLPNEGWSSKQVPFADGQRALRIIRQNAQIYGYNQIGVMGFSAGGHLAGMLAVRPTFLFYQPQDEIDKISARPDFAVLLYPVVSMLSNNKRKTQAYKQLFNDNSTYQDKLALSIEKWVSNNTPPMFIAHAMDDPIAPVEESVQLSKSFEKIGSKSQIVLFNSGGHGWGLGDTKIKTDWKPLFLKWVEQN